MDQRQCITSVGDQSRGTADELEELSSVVRDCRRSRLAKPRTRSGWSDRPRVLVGITRRQGLVAESENISVAPRFARSTIDRMSARRTLVIDSLRYDKLVTT